MSRQPPEQWRPPEPPSRPPRSGPGGSRNPLGTGPRNRWAPWVVGGLMVVAVMVFLSGSLQTKDPDTAEITFGELTEAVRDDRIEQIVFDPDSRVLTGEFKTDRDEDGATKFKSAAPGDTLPDAFLALADEQGVDLEGKPRDQGSVLLTLLSYLFPILLILGLFLWMSRRAQGQMGAVMNIGRSRAKVYTTEKPRTTFSDVAGYTTVKEEITEVVDFLKQPQKFREIGARIPKGVVLVGPPGTGKTLSARAVAGEAGVPFISVTGSDFMEMFVGVGAARVRDLFATARKQAPAIIFVDEIDSIGRKRGAGLGGGHDEREQTLNQMLAEMDGFEATEGIVMMAATNRPDVLDPALLRPGRFDRQILVPLPTQEERHEILQVHFADKRIGPDVDVRVIARGTPGMSGADLANLVNEAALYAVRRGAQEVHTEDFENARDRVLMGLKRPSIMMNDEEKEHTAYHEAGHALTAYVLEHADPVHKVTILPTGMALGMTQQLPTEERYSHDRNFLNDMLVVLMGGRVAEDVVFESQSTGASNDLVRATEIARRMVREFGMSERIGPMAFSSQGQVFLGEDLMHTRDYSDETARVIDEEVERILREQEERSRKTIAEHRGGLDAIAQALLERETVDGDEVARLVDTAMGYKAGGGRKVVHADGTTSEAPLPAPPAPVPPPFSAGD